jgi:HSP20 family protein
MGDPLRDIFSLGERINRLFEDIQAKRSERGCVAWVPTVDVYETLAEFVVRAELPEVKESDIAISVDRDILKISGEKKVPREGRYYLQIERSCGAFSRTFTLPTDVDHSNIRATLNDGILKIVIPKRVDAVPKHIEIE